MYSVSAAVRSFYFLSMGLRVAGPTAGALPGACGGSFNTRRHPHLCGCTRYLLEPPAVGTAVAAQHPRGLSARERLIRLFAWLGQRLDVLDDKAGARRDVPGVDKSACRLCAITSVGYGRAAGKGGQGRQRRSLVVWV